MFQSPAQSFVVVFGPELSFSVPPSSDSSLLCLHEGHFLHPAGAEESGEAASR